MEARIEGRTPEGPEVPMTLDSLITALTTMRDSMGAPGSTPVRLDCDGYENGPLAQVECSTNDEDALIVLHAGL